MGHHDHHQHSEHHDDSPMEFSEKARKLLDHWIRHNNDHALSYRQWAVEFRENHQPDAAVLLESAAELTAQINLAMQQALHHIQPEK